jgi:hypothetical protein
MCEVKRATNGEIHYKLGGKDAVGPGEGHQNLVQEHNLQ